MNRILIAALCAAALSASPATAQFHFVVNNTLDLPDADVSDNQCLASNGSCTLRAAVEQHNEIGGILPRISFQNPGMEMTLGSELVILDDIEITGFGPGFTTIDGDGSRKLWIYGDVTLSGLTITNGSVWVQPGFSLQASNCLFEGSGSAEGGAIEFDGLNLVIENCEFSTNQATWMGGAISASGYGDPNSSLSITDSVFHDNGAGEEGGAIYTLMDTTITGSDFYSNSSAIGGGAVYVGGYDLDITVTGSNLYSNTAPAGGAILVDSAPHTAVVIRDSSLFSNQVTGDGGAILSQGDEVLHVVNSTISSNSAEKNGGGLALLADLTMATVSSSTITANTADAGGDNNDGNGGGIYRSTTSGIIELRNSIVAGNDDATTGMLGFYAPDCDAVLTSYGYNLVGYTNFFCDVAGDPTGNIVGSSADPVDPLLGILIRPGYWPTFAHNLTAGSPAIEAGNPFGCLSFDGAPLTTDQVGHTRPSGLRCDMGAMEWIDPDLLFASGFESGDFTGWAAAP